MFVCTNIHKYVCMFVCIYVCMYVCMYLCMFSILFVCLYVCLFVFLFVCLFCLYACTNIYMHACIHDVHTHTHMRSLPPSILQIETQPRALSRSLSRTHIHAFTDTLIPLHHYEVYGVVTMSMFPRFIGLFWETDLPKEDSFAKITQEFRAPTNRFIV